MIIETGPRFFFKQLENGFKCNSSQQRFNQLTKHTNDRPKQLKTNSNPSRKSAIRTGPDSTLYRPENNFKCSSNQHQFNLPAKHTDKWPKTIENKLRFRYKPNLEIIQQSSSKQTPKWTNKYLKEQFEIKAIKYPIHGSNLTHMWVEAPLEIDLLQSACVETIFPHKKPCHRPISNIYHQNNKIQNSDLGYKSIEIKSQINLNNLCTHGRPFFQKSVLKPEAINP